MRFLFSIEFLATTYKSCIPSTLFRVPSFQRKRWKRILPPERKSKKSESPLKLPRRGIRNTCNNQNGRVSTKKVWWRPKYSFGKTQIVYKNHRSRCQCTSNRNISSTRAFVFNKKCLSRKVKWSLFPSFSSARALSKRDRNFGDNIISRIYLERADRRNHHLTELSRNLDERKTNRREEMESGGWGGPIELRLRRSRWFSERRKSRPESAGEWRRRGRGSRIDRRRWGPTSRRRDLVVLDLGCEKNGIHSESIHSLYSPTYVSHWRLSGLKRVWSTKVQSEMRRI